MPWQYQPTPYCKACGPEDVDRRTGAWSSDCKYETKADCERNCAAPRVKPITLARPCGDLGSQGDASGQPAGSVPGRGTEESFDLLKGGGFGFLSSGGVVTSCACDVGYAWRVGGRHQCGCEGSNAAPTLSRGASSLREPSSAAQSSDCGSCCCCVESVVVESVELPGGRTPDQDPGFGVNFFGNVGKLTQGYIGSSFSLNVKIRRSEKRQGRLLDEDDSKCRLDWYERANTPRDIIPKRSLPPSSYWYDQVLGHKSGRFHIPSFDMWDTVSADPCATGAVTISDMPSLSALSSSGNGTMGFGVHTRRIDPTLDIHIVLASGGACDCAAPAVTVVARQVLRSSGSGLSLVGSSMVFRKVLGRLMPASSNTMGGGY